MGKIRAVVSGSFHRHLSAISNAVFELRERGIEVLSPADPRVVDAAGPFLFVASDRHRSVRLVQDRHLACLCHAHLLWLVCPDGYVGQSASMEIGFAVAAGVPIFSKHLPLDLTLRQYVTVVGTLEETVQMAGNSAWGHSAVPSLLVDPAEAVEEVHSELETIKTLLCSPRQEAVAARVLRSHRKIRDMTAIPGSRLENWR